MGNLIRKYKIYKFSGEVDLKTKEIFEFVDENLLNLDKFEDNKYKDWIFYMNDKGKCILEYNSQNERLYVRYLNFWQVLETKYNLNYSIIQSFIKYRVETAYKLKVKTTWLSKYTSSIQVETAYKLKVKTTFII